METILIFSGGDSPEPGVVDDLPAPDLVLAADGGYEVAIALGYRVDVLIGDLDSVQTDPLPDHVIVERYPVDKDQTDLDLAIELAVREDPTRVVVVGGSGGRHDHELANAALLCSERWDSIDELDWFSARSRAFVVRERRTIHGDVGTMVSLIPMGGQAEGVVTRGFMWELAGEDLPAGSTRGVSNKMRLPVVDIQVGAGKLLVVMAADQP